MTLDELAREYRPGVQIRDRTDLVSWRFWEVLGVVWTLPREPGGADEPGLVVRDRYGVIGCIYPADALRPGEQT